MENLETILSLAGTALGLLLTSLTFLVKLILSIKNKSKVEKRNMLLSAVAPLVELAEKLTHYSGAEKKQYVLTSANQFAIENGIEFDAEAVSGKIEELIELSNQVNKRA